MKRNILSMFIASIIIILAWTFLKIEIASIYGFLTAVASFVIVDNVLGRTLFKDEESKEDKKSEDN